MSALSDLRGVASRRVSNRGNDDRMRDHRGTVVVLHLFGRMDRGGAELRTVQLLDFLDRSRVRTIFGTLREDPGTLDEEIRRRGARVVPVPLGPLWPLRLRAVVKQHEVSVVHSHVALASGLLLACARLVGVRRRIAHFRSDGDGRGDSLPRRLYRWSMRRLITGFATDVVAVSPAALAFSGQAGRRTPRTAVIPSGLDTGAIRRSLKDGAPLARAGGRPTGSVLLHVGRDLAEKNRIRAVRVLLACLEQGLDVSLVLVGEMNADEEACVRSLVERRSVDDRLIILGERGDVPALIAEADVMLLTSTLEGLPGVVLEGCAVGTPCVASDLPGVLWIAEHLEGVMPVSLASPDDVWANAVQKALASAHDASREGALRRFDESIFSMGRAVAAFEALWTRC